ncbi:hypothetical protein ZWY2020_033509 [Hordeum vulgare]|nr:hypothetical protein ZWY2020_033509 [Hordeum vulgare]
MASAGGRRTLAKRRGESATVRRQRKEAGRPAAVVVGRVKTGPYYLNFLQSVSESLKQGRRRIHLADSLEIHETGRGPGRAGPDLCCRCQWLRKRQRSESSHGAQPG